MRTSLSPTMSPARENVTAMAAQAAKGHTPPLLANFLRARFPQSKRRWLARWLFPPRRYDVRRVEPFEDGGFFRTTCVFWVFVKDTFLEGAVLPSGGTYGLFFLGAGGLRYLNHEREDLERSLREEARPLHECDALVLARLLVETLGREKNQAHAVLESAHHLAHYPGDLGGFGGKYALDPSEWKKVKDKVSGPTLSGTSATGWELRFHSLFGWMHDKQTLLEHRIRLSTDYRIERQETVLSRRLFENVPQLTY